MSQVPELVESVIRSYLMNYSEFTIIITKKNYQTLHLTRGKCLQI